ATNGSSAAAALELQSDKAVMAIGGFGGSDPAPTLAQFQADVREGKLTYYVVTSNSRGGGGTGGANAGHTPATGPQGGRQSGAQQGGNAGGPGGSGGPGGFGGRNTHADITNWVTKNFTAQKVGNATVYNLSGYHG
ncbi:MAG: mannosyltransferase, partial [Nocardia sp.]|nr:mannosyltransferase [Nocardia sp.]